MATKIDELFIEIDSNSKVACDNIDRLASSLSKLKEAGKTTTVVNNLKKINTELDKIGKNNSATKNLDKISNSVSKMSGKLGNISKGATKSTKAIGGMVGVFDGMIGKFLKTGVIVTALQKVYDAIGRNVNAMNEYIENVNLFKVSMGDYYEEAFDYAERLQGLMGIDSSEFMRAQGVFMSMANGFGLAKDKAYQLSKGMTEVSYDLASFFNIGNEEAFLKVRSGIAGELEPLRALGFALSQASLQELAYEKGITKKVNAMTEAEKAQLRYVAIVEQATQMNAIGDFARTLESPANAMRILKQQITQLGRAIGSVFIPMITAVIPYIQAFVNVLTEAVKKLAVFFGFDISKYTEPLKDGAIKEPIAEANVGLGSATKKAKELKKALMGFDELNILPSPKEDTGGSGAGAIGTGGDLGIDMQSVWDEALLSTVSKKTAEIVGKVKELFGSLKDVGMIVGSIGLGFLAWEGIKWLAMGSGTGIIASAFESIALYGMLAFDAVVGFVTSLGTGMSTVFLPATLVIGAVASVVYTLWKNFDTVVEVIKTFIDKIKLSEKFEAIKKACEPFSSTMSGLGEIMEFIGTVILTVLQPVFAVLGGLFNGVITAIAPFITAINGVLSLLVNLGLTIINVLKGDFDQAKISVQNIWNSICDIFVGAIDTVIGLVWGFVEGVIGWFTSLWDVLVGHSIVPDMINAIIGCFSNMVSTVVNAVTGFVNTVIGFFKSLYTGVTQAIYPIVNWFNTYIITPVTRFFSNMWNGIKNVAVTSFNGLKSAIYPVVSWFNTYIVTPVSKFFSGMWSGFKTKGSEAWNGVKSIFSNVAKFFKDTFTNAWNGVVKIFSIGGSIFVNIKNGIVSAFKSIVNQLIKGINNVISVPFNAINTVLRTIRDASIMGIKPFKNLINTISVPQIPLLADGGFVPSGQMFIARESGPEMVGQIGGKTAVANNGQIVDGITSGVFEGVLKAMSNSEGNRNITIHNTIELDKRQIGKSVVEYHNDMVAQTGLSPLMI